VNTKQGVKSLIQDVRDKGYTVSASHGGMSQLGRDTAIQEFRAGSSRILIATDLRGTNLGQVPVVINYDLPTQLMQYISRVQQQRRYSETESFFERRQKAFAGFLLNEEKKNKGYNLNELLTMVTAPVLENTTLLCRKKQNTT